MPLRLERSLGGGAWRRVDEIRDRKRDIIVPIADGGGSEGEYVARYNDSSSSSVFIASPTVGENVKPRDLSEVGQLVATLSGSRAEFVFTKKVPKKRSSPEGDTSEETYRFRHVSMG